MKFSQFARVDSNFWKGKRVFLTGHTGFKGGWLSLWLSLMGAKVTGYALAPNTVPNFYDEVGVGGLIDKSIIADVRNLDKLKLEMVTAQPEIVIHMAAQSLVRYSYHKPVETYATNVMGTVHILESIRTLEGVRATVIVTSDKCYENKEWVWGYRENEPMGGYDPYSNSKGCVELIISAFRESYFSKTSYSSHGHALASARAGNVIGGGDWSVDRLIPDALKAFEAEIPLLVRNPFAIRPWQHVLEPLSGYLVLAQGLYERGMDFASAWNFGPRDEDVRTVQEVVDLLVKEFNPWAKWKQDQSDQPHEAHSLKLDCSKANLLLRWKQRWSLEKAIKNISEWQKAFLSGENMRDISLRQIINYQSDH